MIIGLFITWTRGEYKEPLHPVDMMWSYCRLKLALHEKQKLHDEFLNIADTVISKGRVEKKG